MNFPEKEIGHLIDLALQEDLGDVGDLSSQLTIDENSEMSAKLIAKAKGVISGLEIIKLVIKKISGSVRITLHRKDGDVVHPKDLIAELEGNVRDILLAERTFLNFIQRMSGVATYTNQFVMAVGKYPTKILDTRKTLPAYRMMDKYSVVCGGGSNHRMGLYDMVMLKDNHIAACGGIVPALENVFENKPKGVKVEIEVENLEQLKQVLDFPVDQIMLDNMNTEQMSEAVQIVRKQGHSAVIEASGNMTLERVEQVAKAGVDVISIGAITHSVSALDISLRFA